MQIGNKNILKLQPYETGDASTQFKKEFGLNSLIKLASNENPNGPSQKVIKSLEFYFHNIVMYPDGNDLKIKLSENLNIPFSTITLGNGSTELLYMIALGFSNSTSSIIISQYAYAYYKRIIHSIGATMISVPAKGWACDLDAIKCAIIKTTRLIFIDNPNNPTGTIIHFKELKKFINDIPKNIVVVIDEAYYEYVDHPEYSSVISLINDYPNLIVLRTFSKAYGLAGLRIGYGVSSPLVADIINRIKSPFSANSLALIAAQAALDDKDYLKRSVLINNQELKILQNRLDELSINYIPSNSNFLMVNLKEYHLSTYKVLSQKGILIRQLIEYDGLDDYFRITIGLPWMNSKLINILEKLRSK